MPDRGRIIRGFECCHIMVHDMGPDKSSCDICPYKDAQTEEQIDLGGIECIAALHDDAMVLLKEQEAKEVKVSTNMYTGLPITHCPKCGVSIDRYLYGRQYEGQVNYCPYCGQEVMWNA